MCVLYPSRSHNAFAGGMLKELAQQTEVVTAIMRKETIIDLLNVIDDCKCGHLALDVLSLLLSHSCFAESFVCPHVFRRLLISAATSSADVELHAYQLIINMLHDHSLVAVNRDAALQMIDVFLYVMLLGTNLEEDRITTTDFTSPLVCFTDAQPKGRLYSICDIVSCCVGSARLFSCVCG